MKKIGVTSILMLLVLSLLFGAFAEGFKPKEPSFVPTELPETYSFDSAAEIEPGVLYIGRAKKNYHFKFFPKESGEYHFYLRALDELSNDGHGLQFGIFDMYDNYLNMKLETYSRNPVLGVFELTEGEEYRFNNDHYMNWGHYWAGRDFYFAFCSPSRHAGDTSDFEVIQEPTCTEPGYKATHCLLCGGEVVRTEIPALGHTPGEEIIAKVATCIEAGEKYTRCAVCGADMGTEIIPAKGHNPGSEETLAEPTCTTAGVKAVKCLDCGQILSREVLPTVDHQAGQFIQIIAPTCTTKGRNEQHCLICNALLATEEPEAYGHVPGVWEDLVPVTATTDGLRVQRCVLCGETMNSETVKAPASN